MIYDIDVAGIIITGGIGAEMTAEVFDVSTGETCELPQLPDMREYHTQVIFDHTHEYLYKYCVD